MIFNLSIFRAGALIRVNTVCINITLKYQVYQQLWQYLFSNLFTLKAFSMISLYVLQLWQFLGHFENLSKQSILGYLGPFLEQTTFFGKNRTLSLLSVYGTLTSYKMKSEKLMAQFWEIIKNVIFSTFLTRFALFWADENLTIIQFSEIKENV